MSDIDPYKTLGLKQDATDEEIKQAYRRLAQKYHPDRNPGDPIAEDAFKKLGDAYDAIANRSGFAQRRGKSTTTPTRGASSRNSTGSVRVDGLYEAPSGRSFDYLRFYPNKTVQAANTIASPSTAWTWFDETNSVGGGEYVVDGNLIDFSISGGLGKTEYAGTIEGERLVLNWLRDIDCTSGEKTYRFVKWPFTQASREPPSTDATPSGLADLRTEIWKTLTSALGAIAVAVIASFIIISSHIRQPTALGTILTLVILASLWILYASVADLITACTAYRDARDDRH